uniref:Uncharacterized protein n=1 Tax=Kryptolebias marmoratus TaxID=37003 RepID=A0A3Q2ZB83_KRYMA
MEGAMEHTAIQHYLLACQDFFVCLSQCISRLKTGLHSCCLVTLNPDPPTQLNPTAESKLGHYISDYFRMKLN